LRSQFEMESRAREAREALQRSAALRGSMTQALSGLYGQSAREIAGIGNASARLPACAYCATPRRDVYARCESCGARTVKL
jgi:hypothetical protein